MRFGRNDSPMTYRQHWTIATTLHDLTEGIFGHIVLYMFELLPYLDKAGIEPTWELHSRLYGSPPSFVVIPGIFDAVPTADSTPSSRHRRKSFLILRAWHRVALGGATSRGRRISMATAAPSVDRIVQRAKTWLQDFF